jgi:hypothetical protein
MPKARRVQITLEIETALPEKDLKNKQFWTNPDVYVHQVTMNVFQGVAPKKAKPAPKRSTRGRRS